MTLWENWALIQAPVCALLTWSVQGWDKLLQHFPGCLCVCLCLGIKVGKVQRAEVSQQGGVWGSWAPVFALGTALLCFQHCDPIYLGFIVALSLSRNTRESPLIRRRFDRRGAGWEQCRQLCAGSTPAWEGDWMLNRGTAGKQNINFGFSISDGSSLLVYQGKKILQCICGVQTVLETPEFGYLTACEAHQDFILFLWCPFPWQLSEVCPEQEELSIFGIKRWGSRICMEPNDCNYIIWAL